MPGLFGLRSCRRALALAAIGFGSLTGSALAQFPHSRSATVAASEERLDSTDAVVGASFQQAGCGAEGCGAADCGCEQASASACGCAGPCCCGECSDDGCGCLGVLRPFSGCGSALSDLGEPRKWFGEGRLAKRGVQVGGWLAQSYTWNPYQPNDRFNGPVTWTDRANEYQLNELYGFISKPLTNNGEGFGWGYRVDALYGTNYRWDTAGGLESNINGHQFYGLALPQAYLEAGFNDLTVKVGHFVSPVGYYTVGTNNNFFPFLPYTYQYGEPFTHTGAIATYKVGDRFNFGGGITKGWDNFDNTGNPHVGYLGTMNFTLDEKRSLAWVGVYGPEPNLSGFSGGFTTRYLQTLVYTRKFSDNVMGVLQSDFGVQGDATAATGAARWYGVNSYLYWGMTRRMQWGLNGEWFRDEGGFRVGQVLPSVASPDARGFARGPGFDGSFYVLSFGPKFFFTPNLYGRAALRADWYDGKRAGVNLPFDDGNRRYQQIVAMDLVYTF